MVPGRWALRRFSMQEEDTEPLIQKEAEVGFFVCFFFCAQENAVGPMAFVRERAVAPSSPLPLLTF